MGHIGTGLSHHNQAHIFMLANSSDFFRGHAVTNMIIGLNAKNLHFVHKLLQKELSAAIFFLIVVLIAAVLNYMHKNNLSHKFTQATNNIQRL